MTIGTSNSTTLSFIKESTAGTTPSSPAMQLLRFTGESLESTNTTTTSEEIRSDRATSDLVLTDQTNSGEINVELTATSFDALMEGALFTDATWTSTSITATTIAVTATGFTDSGNGFISGGLQVGQTFSISGTANAFTNLTKFRVVTLAAGVVTTYPVPFATESVGNSMVIKGSTIKSGKTDHSYTIQKSHTGLATTVYQNFRGARVSTMSQDLSVGSLATMAFGFTALNGQTTEDQISGLSNTAVTTTPVMSTVGNVSQITAVGTGVTTLIKFTTLSFSYDNALRELKSIGSLGSVDVRAGTIMATATINPYFEDIQLLTAFNANTSFHLSWIVSDTTAGVNGNSYIFSFPNVKFTAQSLAAGSKDADMIINGTVQAILDPASLTTMRIDRFTA